MDAKKVTFWGLLERSIIVQSLITLMIIGVDLYLYATVGVLPKGLDALTYMVVAFWMGSKVQHTVDQHAITRR